VTEHTEATEESKPLDAASPEPPTDVNGVSGAPDTADLDADAVAAEPDAFDAEGEPRPRSIVSFVGRSARRIGVTVGGFVLLAVGVAGLALPIIPGIPLIIAGLALLASEYAWARRALERARARAMQAVKKVRRSGNAPPTDA
jgi:hypothetical protein